MAVTAVELGTVAVKAAIERSGIAPENSRRIPGRQLIPTGISLETYNAVLDKIDHIYSAEIAAEKSGVLAIERLWASEKVNAYALRSGLRRIIVFPGGLARHPEIDRDAFALVACHEIGHHRGGAPIRARNTWASVEGQADYFANLKCMRRFFEDEDNEVVMKNPKLDELTRGECEKEFSSRNDQLACMRSVVAAKGVTMMLRDLAGETTVPDVATPDAHIADATNQSYPGTQCRIDTFLNAARCPVPTSEGVSPLRYQDGTCDQSPYNTGSRPQCWFKR
ncbi:MAG: hypothetical protein V4692_15980 [Bdellovibrionota bacterium]